MKVERLGSKEELSVVFEVFLWRSWSKSDGMQVVVLGNGPILLYSLFERPTLGVHHGHLFELTKELGCSR